VQLGLEAEQVMVPVDHVLLAEAQALPAIVVRHPAGVTHFVIAWSCHGGFVQVMDPAIGAGQRAKRLLDNSAVHTSHPADAWQWAGRTNSRPGGCHDWELPDW